VPQDIRLKIAFVESSADMGGVQFTTLYFLQHLNSREWDAVVICPKEGDLSEACRRSNIEVNILGFPHMRSVSFRISRNGTSVPNILAWVWNLWATLVASHRLALFVKKAKPDLVVTKGIFPHLYGGFVARCFNIPCVWHVQDFISERFLKIYQRIFTQLARWLPNHIIVDGASILRQLATVQDRVTVIHNGIDTGVFRPNIDGQAFRREMSIPFDATVIGSVGRMTPWKGQHYLLEAFARIAAKDPNVYLLFVGSPVFDNDSFQRYLLDRTSKLGLNHIVKFAGYRHDIPSVMASMNVFAFTSTEKDTSPLALLSAMSSALPIVAFDIEGVRELMTDQEFLAVPVKRIDALAESLTRLLTDRTLCSRLSRSARDRAVEEFSLRQHIFRMEKVLLSVVRKARSESTTVVESCDIPA